MSEQIVTSTGFVAETDVSRVNDMRFLETIRKLQRGDLLAYIDCAEMILGEEGKERLYEHIKDKDGHVPTEKFNQELTEIIQGLNHKKK